MPLIATLAMLFGIPALALSTANPAAADATHQVAVDMPFTGKWAYNANVSAPWTDANSSHPSVHHRPGTGDWATDLYGAEGTDVKLKLSNATNNLTFSWGTATTSCGEATRINVFVGGVQVGWVYFAHIDNAVTSGDITNGMTIGTVHNWGGCNPGTHVHVEYRNISSYSCWVGHGNPGTTVSSGDHIGVLGSTNTGAQQECGGIPNPDTDSDGVPNSSDQCPNQAGPASNNGCPVSDSDGDGVVNSSDACTLMPGAATNRGCRMDGHTVSGNFTGDSKTDAVTFYDYGSDNLGSFLETGSSVGLSKPAILWTTGTGQWTWANSYFVSGNFAGNDGWTDVVGFYDYGNSKLGAFLFQGNGNGVSQAVHLWTTGNNAWGMGSAKYVVGNFSGNDGVDDIMAFYGYSGDNMGVFVFPGNGSGIDQVVGQWTTGPNAWNVKSAEFVAGNFNGDGYTDVYALYDYGNNNLGGFLLAGSSGNLGQPVGQWTTGQNGWNLKSGLYAAGDYNHDGKDDIAALYDLGNANLGGYLFASSSSGNGVAMPTNLWTTGTGAWYLSTTKMVAGDFGSGPSLFTFYDYSNSNTGGALLSSTSAGFGMPAGGWATGAGQWNWVAM